MICDQVAERIDDYLRGDLHDASRQAFDRHLADCGRCRALADGQQEMLRRLRLYGQATMPEADDGFYDRAIARAAVTGTRRERNRWIMTGFGGAVAALLVVWVVSGAFLTATDVDRQPVPGVTMALQSPQTFNLVFSSATALTDASMTVTLPDGIEIAGFAGQQEISWRTSLKAGENILPLTLIATSFAGGELLATLRHEDDDKIFRLQVSVIQS